MAMALVSICEVCGIRVTRRYRYCPKHKPNGPKPIDVMERVWAKVDKSGDCWNWQGATDTKGYGKIGIGSLKDGTRTLAIVHRLIYMHDRHVDLTSKEYVCHTCDNRACCNPAHLFLGDAFINLVDMSLKGRARGQKRPGKYGSYKSEQCGEA
jgi:hypothetical protein